MEPFTLRIDWTCHYAYGDAVVVELHRAGSAPRVLRRFTNPPDAGGWARRWLDDRGFDFTCDIDGHQRRDDRHVVLYPVRRPSPD